MQNKEKTTIFDALDAFNLKTLSKRVFVCLVERGEQNVSDIAGILNCPKSSVYDSLNELIKNGLVIELFGDRSSSFVSTSLEQIDDLKNQKTKNITDQFDLLQSFLKENKRNSGVSRPRIKFYNGIDGIKQSFRDMSWHKNCKEAFLMWPMQDMINTLGEDFLSNHGKDRFKFGVVLRSIRKEEERGLEKIKWLKSDLEENLREVRYLPKDFSWNMSFWLYGDKCLFAGSGEEKFSFIIQSRDFANLMKLCWQGIWMMTKK